MSKWLIAVIIVLAILIAFYVIYDVWYRAAMRWWMTAAPLSSGAAPENYAVAPEADPTLYGPLVSGMGPYHLQIYDTPHYYPYYKGSQQVPWDFYGKCSVSCTPDPGDPEKRCAVWCR